jgi:hypothetical protein
VAPEPDMRAIGARSPGGGGRVGRPSGSRGASGSLSVSTCRATSANSSRTPATSSRIGSTTVLEVVGRDERDVVPPREAALVQSTGRGAPAARRAPPLGERRRTPSGVHALGEAGQVDAALGQRGEREHPLARPPCERERRARSSGTARRRQRRREREKLARRERRGGRARSGSGARPRHRRSRRRALRPPAPPSRPRSRTRRASRWPQRRSRPRARRGCARRGRARRPGGPGRGSRACAPRPRGRPERAPGHRGRAAERASRSGGSRRPRARARAGRG